MIFLDISSFFGRFHPLLTHLPIGFLILSILLETYSSLFKTKISDKVISFSWFLGFLSSGLSAFLGWLLSKNGLYIEENLYLHKLFGFILVGITFIAWVIRLSFFKNLFSKNFKFLINFSVLLILVLAGHYGGNMTHGENYLLEYAPEKIKNQLGKNENIIPKIRTSLDSIQLYSEIIEPIFINKCFSCHNNEITRGNLNFSSLPLLLKGGSGGSPINKGNPRNSLIFKRITLPSSNIKFMPPDGPIVSYDEINTILWWIENSDKSEKALSSFDVPAKIKISLNTIYNINFREKSWYEKIAVPELDKSVLSKVDTSVFQVDFVSSEQKFISVKYLKNNLTENEFEQLGQIKDHVAYLSVKASNLSDEFLDNFLILKNLVRLDVQKNSISDDGVKVLQNLENLEVLNLYETKVSKNSLSVLKNYKNLKRVYVWGTKISKKDLESFNTENKAIELIGGI